MTEETRSSTHRETIPSATSQMAMPSQTRTRPSTYPPMRSRSVLVLGDVWQIIRRIVNTWFILYCIIAVASLFVLYGLTRSPVTWDDEVFFADPARTLANSGSLATPIFFNLDGLGRHFFIQPPVYFIMMGAAYRVFGFSEIAARLGSAIPYIGGIVTAFFLTRSISSNIGLARRHASVAGLLAAFLIAFNEQSIIIARSGRPDSLAILLLFLGWTIVTRVIRVSAHRLIWVTAGFSFMQLAGLTHPALAAPPAGIILATTFRPTRFGITRRTVLAAGLASVGLVTLPYAAWALSDLHDWRAQFLHVVVSAGSGHYGSFLSAQLQNVVQTLQHQPAIVLLIIIGIAAFPWRQSLDSSGALIGMGIVAAASTDSYIKFLFLIALIPAAAGLVRLATKLKDTYRRLTTVLIMLGLLNGLMFPLLRAYEIHQFYRQRDPMLITDNIARFVPHGAHLMGISGVYFATISDDAQFRKYQLLEGVTWGDTQNLQSQFRLAVERYNPTWFALPPGMNPEHEYCYLNVRFRRVSAINVQVSSGLNPAGQSSVAYTLWTTSPGTWQGC
jgi:hypothetical protein